MPSWSTARHSQCFLPAIFNTTSSRCHLSPVAGRRRRIWLAKSWPNLSAHCRTLSWLTMMPRAASISSTMRKLSGKRKYSQAAWLIPVAYPTVVSSPSPSQVDMALLRAGALQLQPGSDGIGPAEESWHGTVCWTRRLAGADLGLCRRRRRHGDLGRQVRLYPGGNRRDPPHEGARGGAHRSGERSLVGLALARAAEAGTARGLPRRSARQGGARPAAEQV